MTLFSHLLGIGHDIRKKDALEQQRLCFDMAGHGEKTQHILCVRAVKHWKILPQWLFGPF